MVRGPQFVFAPFRLDPANEELWREDQRLAIRRKPFVVLRYLVERAGLLVLREELEKQVWPKVHVSNGVLRGYVGELRALLGDDADAPRFIETAQGRGYRFVAPVMPLGMPVQSAHSAEPAAAPTSALQAPKSLDEIVGREAELQR